MLISGSGWGTVFYCFLQSLHDSLVRESGWSGNDGAGKLFRDIKNLSSCRFLWKVESDNIQCIHLCFCMLAISFYFVNCVIISCELYYDNSFGCILTNYK